MRGEFEGGGALVRFCAHAIVCQPVYVEVHYNYGVVMLLTL
jgi:hypothetical protein